MTRPAMIFAAGFGTRMGALTRDRPKPLIAVAGRALIDHALDRVRAVGARPVVVNAHYRAVALAAHLRGVADVRLRIETPDILDTGGGLKAALPLLGGGAVFTLNSDAIFTGPEPLVTLARAWRPGMGALLLTVPRARAVGRQGGGDFVYRPGGRLERDRAGEVFTGAQIIDTAHLTRFPDGAFSLNLVWDTLAAEGALFGVSHAGCWADVGHPAGIDAAEAMLEEADGAQG